MCVCVCVCACVYAYLCACVQQPHPSLLVCSKLTSFCTLCLAIIMVSLSRYVGWVWHWPIATTWGVGGVKGGINCDIIMM